MREGKEVKWESSKERKERGTIRRQRSEGEKGKKI